MSRGGTRPGAGRRKGSKNQHTKEREAAIEVARKKLAKTLPDAFDGDAHALLMAVYQDASHPIRIRVDAAAKALPYEKPALKSYATHGQGRWPADPRSADRKELRPIMNETVQRCVVEHSFELREAKLGTAGRLSGDFGQNTWPHLEAHITRHCGARSTDPRSAIPSSSMMNLWRSTASRARCWRPSDTCGRPSRPKP